MRGRDLAAWLPAIAVVGIFAWILVDLAARGLPGLSWRFLVEAPAAAGRAGGIAPILASTAILLAVCIAAVVPLGLGTAILLAELGRTDARYGSAIRASLDVLGGVPSIVFGLFGNAFFCQALGMGFSLLSGGLTLACMVLPLAIRTSEEALRAVPAEWRAGAAALGLSETATIVRVVVPAAAPGLAAGLVLAVGRALAETAALIFTSGYVDRMPRSLLDSGRALSVHVYDLAMNVAGGDANACATALVLVLALIAVHGVSGALASRVAA